MDVCKIWDNEIEGKRSKEYFIILALEESFDLFFWLEFIFENCKHRETGLKHKLKDSGFLETKKYLSSWMKIVALSPCICFTELYFFYWLLV